MGKSLMEKEPQHLGLFIPQCFSFTRRGEHRASSSSWKCVANWPCRRSRGALYETLQAAAATPLKDYGPMVINGCIHTSRNMQLADQSVAPGQTHRRDDIQTVLHLALHRHTYAASSTSLRLVYPLIMDHCSGLRQL